MEHPLSRSASWMNSVLEASLSGVLVFEPLPAASGEPTTYRATFANRAAGELIGTVPDRVVGNSLSNLFPNDAVLRVHFDRVIARGEAQRFEFEHPNPARSGASRTWFDASVNHLDGGVVMSFNDVTATRQVQAQADKTIARLHSILDGSPAAIGLLESVRDPENPGHIADFTVVSLNEQFCTLMKYTAADLIGRRFRRLFRRSLTARLYDRFVRVVETGVPLREELHFDKGPLQGWFDLTAVRQGDGLTITVLDVTAYREAADKARQTAFMLETVLDRAQAGVTWHHAVRADNGEIEDFQVVAINEASAELFARINPDLRGQALTGRRLSQFFPQAWDLGLFDRFVNVVETGEAVRYERTYPTDGGELWFDVSAVKQDDGLILTFVDITRLKESELQAEATAELLGGVFDASPWAIVYLAPEYDALGNVADFVFQIANARAEKIGQRPLAQLFGGRLLEMYPRSRDLGLFEEYVRVLETGKPFEREVFYDGEGIARWSHIVAVRQGEGLVLTNSDVTARKVAELENEESLRMLQGVLTSAPTAIWWLESRRDAADPGRIVDFSFTLFNLHAIEMTHRSASELHAQPLRALFPKFDDTGLFADFVRVVETGRPFQRDVRYDGDNLHGWFNVQAARHGDGVVVQVLDITDRKGAEQRLQEETRRLNEAQTIGRVGSFEWNAGEEFTVWSDELYRLLGLEPQSRPITVEMTNQWVHPDDWPGVDRLKQQSFETPGAYVSEHRIFRPDGEMLWVVHRFESLADETGRVVRVRGTVQDITDRKRTEGELLQLKDELAQRAEGRYQILFTNMAQGFCLIEKVRTGADERSDFRYLTTNPAFERHTGLSNVVGKTLRQMLPGVESDILDLYDEVVRAGQPRWFETYVSTLHRWIEAEVFPAPEPGQIAVLFTNTTERKQAEIALRESEARFRAFVTSSSDVVYRMSADWTEMRSLVGKDFIADTTDPSRTWLDTYIHPDDQPTVLQRIGEAIETKGVFELEHRVLRVDGSLGWTDSRAIPLLDEAGEITGWFGTARDVTERRETEERLRWAAEMDAFRLGLADVLRPLADPLAIQQAALQFAAGQLDLDRLLYNEIDADVTTYTVRACYVREGFAAYGGPHPMGPFTESVRALQEGITKVVYDVQTDESFSPEEKAICAGIRVGAFVTVPLLKDGRWVLNLVAHSSKPRPWTPQEVSLLEETAERTWAAVERAQAEEALRESEEKFRTLFNSIDEGYCLIETIFDEAGKAVDFRYLETNPIFERQTGQVNIAGKLASETSPHTEAVWFESLGDVARMGNPLRFENYHADTGRWYAGFASRVGGAGSSLLTLVFDDITERKRREANLALFAEIAEDFARLASETEIMRSIGERLAKHLRLDGFNFSEFDEQLDAATIKYSWNTADVPQLAGTFRHANFHLTDEFDRRMRAGETWVIRDTQSDERLDAQATAAIGVGAFIVVPFHQRGKWQGTFTATSRQARDWTADEIALIEEVSNRTFPRLDRARAEAALRESEARLQLALSAANLGTFAWYVAEDRTEADACALAHFGFPPDAEATLSESLARIFHPEDGPRYVEVIGRAIDPIGSGTLHQEFRIRRADGERWLSVVASTVFEGDPPAPTRITGVLADITERKRREADLAFLAEVSLDLERLTNIDETMNALGAKIAAHLGLSACVFAELFGENEAQIAELTHGWHRADTPSLLGTYRMSEFMTLEMIQMCRRREAIIIRDVFADPKTDGEQYATLNIGSFVGMPLVRDGEWRFLLVVYRSDPHDWSEDEIALVRELTSHIWTQLERARAEVALRLNEEKYRAVFESLDEGVSLLEVLFDDDGRAADYRFVENNPAVEQMTGVGNSTGKTVLELFPEMDRQLIETAGEVVRSGRSVRFQHAVPALGRWFDVHEARVGGDDSRTVVAVFADITERKQQEQRQEFLLKLSDALRAETSVGGVGNRATQLIANQLGADRVYLVTLTPVDDTVVVTHETRRGDLPPLLGSYRSSDFPSAIKEIFERTIVYTDVRTDARLSDPERLAFAGLGAVGFIATSIRRGSEAMIWAAGALSTGPRAWTSSEITLFEDAVERTWAAVEHARAEAALRESEARFRGAFEQARVGIVQTTLEGQILVGNPGFCHLLGYTDEEARTLTVRDITHPDDYEPDMALARRVIASEIQGYTFEKRYVRKSGEIIWVQLTSSLVRDAAGQPDYAMAVVEDITERKQAVEALRESEERMRLLIESANDYSIFTTDAGGFITSWSEGAHRLFGWTADEAIGQHGELIFTPEDRAAGAPEQELATARREGHAPDERFHLRKDGSRFYVSGVVTPIQNGGSHGFVKIARDMTERMRAEQQLRELNENLERLVDERTADLRKNFTLLQQAEGVAQMGSWAYRPASGSAPGVFEWSEGMYRLFGLEPGTPVRPETYLDFVVEADRAVAERIVAFLTYPNGQTLEEQFRIRTDEGVKTIRIKAVTQRNAAGEPERVLGVDLDITAQVEAERQVAESAQTLRSILDGAQAGITLLKAVREYEGLGPVEDFIIENANHLAAELNGIPMERTLGHRCSELFPHYKAIGLFDRYVEVVETGRAQRFEAPNEGFGPVAWFDVSLAKHGDGLVLTFADISDLKNLQLRHRDQAAMLQGVLDSSANSLAVYEAVRDERGRIQDFSVQLFNQAALDSANLTWPDVESRTLLQISPHSKEIGIFHSAVEVLETGQPQQITRDYPYLGKSFRIALSRFGTNGLIVGSVEITELRQAHRQQEELLDELRKSNLNLEQFAYVTSHDLQEPLRKIQSFGLMLQKRLQDRLEPTDLDLIRRMQDAAARMKALIEDLLTFSRLTAKKEAFRLLNLDRLAREVLNDLESAIQEKGAQVHVGPLPRLKGDAMQWRQLLQNLFSNALKFSRPGVVPEVTVAARTVRHTDCPDVTALKPQHAYWEVTVADNGIGFDDAYREKIFEMFQRLHGRAEYSGTGIGLAIAKKVAEQHGGCITAHGRVGEGATFRIYIPAPGQAEG